MVNEAANMCKGCRLGRFASSQGVAVDGTSREWVLHEATSQVANRFQDGSITLPGTERIEKDMCSPLHPLTQPQDGGKLVAHSRMCSKTCTRVRPEGLPAIELERVRRLLDETLMFVLGCT